MITNYIILGILVFCIIGFLIYWGSKIFWKAGFEELDKVLNNKSIKLKKDDTTQK
jgi:hypothetical protein